MSHNPQFKSAPGRGLVRLYLIFVLGLAGASAYTAWTSKSWISIGQDTWKEQGPSAHGPGVHHK